MAQQSIVGGLFGPTPAQIRQRMQELQSAYVEQGQTFSERMGRQAGMGLGQALGGLLGRDMTSPELREAQQQGQMAQQALQEGGGMTYAGAMNAAKVMFDQGDSGRAVQFLELAKQLRPAEEEGEPARVRELRIRAEEAGLKPGTPEYQDFMLAGGSGGGMSLTFNPETGQFEFTQGMRGGAGAGKIQDQVIVSDPTSPTGTRIVPVPGGKPAQEAEKRERELEAQGRTRSSAASVALRETDYLLKELGFNKETGELEKSNVGGPRMRALAAEGKLSFAFAGSRTGNFLNTLQSFKDTVSIETLLQIKAAGSGLGNVPQSQLEALARVMGSLDPSLSDDLLAKNLKDAEDIYRAIFESSIKDVNDPTFREILPGIAEGALQEARGAREEPDISSQLMEFEESYQRGIKENPQWTPAQREQWRSLLQKEFGIQ